MKKSILFLLLILPLLYACEGGGNDDYEPVTILPDYIGGYQLQGIVETIDSGPFTTYSGYSGNMTITSPSAAHIKVDGYVRVTGTNSTFDPLYIGIYYDNSIQELYPVDIGSFDKYIYFRKKGTVYLRFYEKISENSYGTRASITVTSTSDKIKYLAPSTRIQAFDDTIMNLASTLKATVEDSTDIESVAKAYHDYIVKQLYYDFDSLTNRKPQDALSVLANGMAVCEGYATLYTALLRASGIKAQVYTGQNHAWNKVYWNGTWHDVDVTWDDPVMNDGGTCNTETGQYCNSDFPDGYNLRHTYFDTGFTGEDGHIGVVEDYYK